MKNLKLFISYFLISLTFTLPKAIDGIESISKAPNLIDKNLFSIRKNMIEVCIKQYNILHSNLQSNNLTYGNIYDACEALYPLYESRVEFNKDNHLDDQASNKVHASWMMTMHQKEWTLKWYTGCGPLTPISVYITPDELENLKSSIQLIREDILEGIRIYEGLYGDNPWREELF